MRTRRAFSCALWVCLSWSGAVLAQDSASTVEAAKQLHRAAVEDFARGDYHRAVDGFIAADRLTPRAGFLFNIAKSYDALQDVPHALAAYRGYLRQSAAAPDAKQVAHRVSILSAQHAKSAPAARVDQISVLSQPLGAQVYVDDAPVGTTPFTLDLSFGEHVVALSLPGYRELRSSIKVVDDQPVDLSFSLVAISEARPTPAPVKPAPHALAQSAPAPVTSDYTSTRSNLQMGGFVSLSAGIVALGAGLAFEAMRARTEQGARHESVQTEFAQDLATIQTQQTLARVFAGGGVLLAAVGGVLLGLAYTSSERKPAPAGVALACTPSNCQGVVSGVF